MSIFGGIVILLVGVIIGVVWGLSMHRTRVQATVADNDDNPNHITMQGRVFPVHDDPLWERDTERVRAAFLHPSYPHIRVDGGSVYFHNVFLNNEQCRAYGERVELAWADRQEAARLIKTDGSCVYVQRQHTIEE